MWESLEVLTRCLMRISDSASTSRSYEATKLDWTVVSYCVVVPRKTTASLPLMLSHVPAAGFGGRGVQWVFVHDAREAGARGVVREATVYGSFHETSGFERACCRR